jgi:23S rRNA pseudouridine2457 synthase
MLIAFYKPFGVLSQFTPNGSANRTLAEFGFPPHVYPIGRLDADSEGLLLLSDEAALNERLLHPNRSHPREYWAQVEGTPTDEILKRLARGGLHMQGHFTKPCTTHLLSTQDVEQLSERVPPIRFRKSVPTAWISLELTEGKNRQVRRMTAAVGLPTLRLVRVRIGLLWMPLWEPSAWRELTREEQQAVEKNTHPQASPYTASKRSKRISS